MGTPRHGRRRLRRPARGAEAQKRRRHAVGREVPPQDPGRSRRERRRGRSHRTMVRSGFMPNLIFSGPPGCGKTSAIGVLARELLGDKYKEAVLEMNASDERGIDVVRNKIKMFAQKKVTLAPGRTKLVILDEADSMTTAAQQAMRRTMEIYSATTRFALACNTSEKVRADSVEVRHRAFSEIVRRTSVEAVDARGGGGEGAVRAEGVRGDRVHRGRGHETGAE